MGLSDLSNDEIKTLKWYYSIELRKGIFTHGEKFINVIATKELLRKISFQGSKVLDIGVMEGVLPVLISRGGADVTAYDRMDLSGRISFVKEAYQVDFQYYPGEPFYNFAQNIQSNEAGPFDIIVMSGVLYHVIDPLLFIYYTRCLMTTGSVLVLETAAVTDSECRLHFNNVGRFYKGTNYYQVSSAWLDYVLRYLGFRIIDVAYVGPTVYDGDKDVIRLALICVLADHPVLSQKDDIWGHKQFIMRELKEYLPIKYSSPVDAYRYIANVREDLPKHKGLNSVDVTETIFHTRPLSRDEDSTILHLDSVL